MARENSWSADEISAPSNFGSNNAYTLTRRFISPETNGNDFGDLGGASLAADSGAGGDAQVSQKPVRILSRRIAERPQEVVIDASVPPVRESLATFDGRFGRRTSTDEAFGERFQKWGYSPATNAPQATSDRPDSFKDRFGLGTLSRQKASAMSALQSCARWKDIGGQWLQTAWRRFRRRLLIAKVCSAIVL